MKTTCHYILILLVLSVLSSCHGNKAKDLIGVKLQAPGIEKLTEQINASPNDPELYNLRAKAYLEKKETDNALTDINKALSFNGNKAAFYCTLSDIYFAMGKVGRCNDALDKALVLDPKNPDALMKEAELNFFFKRYNKTFEFIQKVLELDKINPAAYFMRGMALKESGDTARSIADLQTTIEQDPKNFEAMTQLGLLFAAKKNKIAVDYFNNALNINPKSIESRYAIAMYYQDNEEYNKAIESYNTIIQQDPGYKFAYYNLGYIHLVYLKVYDVAIDYFTRAIKCDANYFEAYFNRGYCYELRGDVYNARADYKKALELKSNYPRAIDGLNRLDKLMKQ